MIRLLIVDDSPLMRRLLVDIFTSAGDFVVETARNGQEALEALPRFKPQVITLDIHMPGMDGLACLDQIMLQWPCPVVMLSSLTAEGASETLDAMALGAIDFVTKPKGPVSLEIDAVAPDLIEKVRSAASVKISKATRLRERVRARATATPARRGSRLAAAVPSLSFEGGLGPQMGVVLVGCSTGGPAALDVLLGGLPANFPWPVVIAQHMPATFTGPLARRLDKICPLKISEVDKPVQLEPGNAYIGRGDADLLLSRRHGALIAMAAPMSSDHYWHPSVERLVESAMRQVAPEHLIGVLLTGMGTDGASAMTELKTLGGQTIAESAETAVVWGMPGALAENGGATLIRPLEQIPGALIALLSQ